MVDDETLMRFRTIAPLWLDDVFDGRDVIGWQLVSIESDLLSGRLPVGYKIVTDGVIYDVRLDGYVLRATGLNMLVREVDG
jgi:hypothetical protein